MNNMGNNFKRSDHALRGGRHGARGRPRSPRRIGFTPHVYFFKPQGIPLRKLETEILSKEELEAVRLKNMDGFHQGECARKMGVSQSTFQRILTAANKKIATALVKGRVIRIFKEE